MNLRGLVAVTGRTGLFRLIGQNKNGFVIESLDNTAVRHVVNLSTTKLATLEDITIFGEEEEIRLIDVFYKIKENPEVMPDVKADGATLRNFFKTIVPNHDESRVYTSDIKKVITWYNIIRELPLFEEPEPEPLNVKA